MFLGRSEHDGEAETQFEALWTIVSGAQIRVEHQSCQQSWHYGPCCSIVCGVSLAALRIVSMFGTLSGEPTINAFSSSSDSGGGFASEAVRPRPGGRHIFKVKEKSTQRLPLGGWDAPERGRVVLLVPTSPALTS